ncbi:hypothetical protein CVT24_002975 [Panaeolus cyanescens]|uniref:F-box domain-containing protein n=1 Tax=Panaeolus cyanescens TaxID=181874 RepID=A0A409VU59_9AGAR|nr:hypothetical protein CVT24_002975 [Panaeolus cyanescens]
MHPIFQCPSIIQQIVSDIELTQHDVLQVALTCRFFQGHALDIIWENLETGILPLFQVLPNLGCREEQHSGEDSYSNRVKERTTTTYFLKDTVTPSDVEKLKSYGRRVRSISCLERKMTDLIDASTYVAVISALEGQLLFPNLRHLDWNLYSSESSAVFFLFHSPHLTRVEFNCSNVQTINPSWIQDTSMFIHRLVRQNVQLFDLRIDIPCSQAMADLVMSAFPSIVNLALDLDSSTIIGHRHLVSMPNIGLLKECHLEGESLQFAFGEDTPRLAFPSLDWLSFTGKIDQAIMFLSSSTFPVLACLSHTFWVPPTHTDYNLDWMAFFNALKQATTSTLTDISLQPWKQTRVQRARGYHSFIDQYSGVDFDTVFPCLSQFDLHDLNFRFPFFTRITMDNLKAITAQWPRLVTLSLHTASREKLGLPALAVIADNLPRLRNLSLDIDPKKSWGRSKYLSFVFLEENKKECCALALTCRDFRNPAQDVLWRCVDCGIFPLLRLLPTFTVRERYSTDHDKGNWFLNGAISPSALEHLALFANRVRELTFAKRKRKSFVEAPVYTVVVQALQGKPLFPNLQRLSIVLNKNDCPSFLQLLHSPRLKELDLNDLREQNPMGSDIPIYLQVQSNYQTCLAALAIKLPCTADMLNIATSAFSHLSVLQLCIGRGKAINFGHLVNMATLPGLRQLNLEMDYPADFNAIDKAATVCFKQLRHLSVCCIFADILGLLSHITCPILYSFAYSFPVESGRGRYPTREWATLFDAIRLTAPGLKEFYAAPSKQYGYDDFLRYYPGVPFSDIAESLLQLNLVALGFEFPFFNVFTLEDLKSIISTWPRITFLHIHGAPNTTPAVFDISVLELIAVELPHLRDLSIDLDVSTLRAIRAIPQSYTHPLLKLSVQLVKWADTFGNCGKFVSYVDALFPRLASLAEFDHQGSRSYREKRVAASMNVFLRHLQTVRFYERERQGVQNSNAHSPSPEQIDGDGSGYPVRLMPNKLDAGKRIIRASY